MSRILLASDSADLRGLIATATGEPISVIAGAPLPAGPSQLFQQLGSGVAIPQVVVIDTATDRAGALGLSSRLATECPGMAVVLVSEQPDTLALAALRAGACDVVHPGADVAELAEVLGRAALVAATTAPQGPGDPAMNGNADARGRVISVVSPKGGVGKTTVSTNLAVGLARTAPLSTVLVDLDVQFGDVASALNLTPEHTLLDVVRGPAVQDSMVLKTFLTQHQTGLYTVCAPTSPAEADEITAADVARLLKTLSSEFRYVVVDTAPGLGDHALAAIDQADELIMLTSLDVPGVRGLRKEIDILRDLGLTFESRHVVINFADPRSGLTKADVEATIGTGVDLVLPRSKAAPVSVNQGIPLLQSDTRDQMTKQLRKLVDRFTPAPMRPAGITAPILDGGRHRLRRKRVKA
ncbi:CpaE family protein [Rhodococcus sp. IEGM 1408]|uniref:AAA family ATPase n=1 Tax=Rhodococcus sp. IEGM 1408 TaxID=3082220 RepID=UPI002952FA62|nr:AAA family ATPase [Rhodococcus sp. IEGM 1408]MDV7999867.1 AAA family ATPase [Rhodococcus sp. IEGM 1408]